MTVPGQQNFYLVQVFQGVAERSGEIVDRGTIRGSRAICRSMTELTRKVRSMGDGAFYVAAKVWPEGVTRIPLIETWTTFG